MASLQELSGYFRNDGLLKQVVRGALIDSIHQHGPITLCNYDSAARRISMQIYGAIKSGAVKREVPHED